MSLEAGGLTVGSVGGDLEVVSRIEDGKPGLGNDTRKPLELDGKKGKGPWDFLIQSLSIATLSPS